MSTVSFRDLLQGDTAFYNQANYVKTTTAEFASDTALPELSYRFVTKPNSSEYKIITVTKNIFLLPYKFLRTLITLPIVPSLFHSIKYATKCRNSAKIDIDSVWKYKRLTIEIDGYKIDAMIVGKVTTLANRRWMLASGGNGELYEFSLIPPKSDVMNILERTNSNALLFNYPGVGASTGFPSREAIVKAYQVMLKFLEDQENGMGANQIIGYGHSIGGAVQGEALLTHELKRDIKYVFIKSRTFSDLSTEVSNLLCRPLGFLIKLLGWNIGSTESSKKLTAWEIILQTANTNKAKHLHDSATIGRDKIIPTKATLAKALLDQKITTNKIFLGILEGHNDGLFAQTTNELARIIHERLR